MVVSDGIEGPRFDNVGSLKYSARSDLAYVGIKKNKPVVVYNGEKQSGNDSVGEFIFSPDGNHYVYRAFRNSRWVVVYDGKEGKEYVDVRKPVFSSDSKRIAYAAYVLNESKDKIRMCMVIDGREQDVFEKIEQPYFSPNGKHCAYITLNDGEWRLMVDGVLSKVRFKGFLKGVPLVFDKEREFHAFGMRDKPYPGIFKLKVSITAGATK